MNHNGKTKEQLEQFRKMADLAPYGCAMSDIEGNIIYINDSFADMHGYTVTELIGKNLSIFHTQAQMETVDQTNKRLLETGKGIQNKEVWHVHRNGTEFPTLMSNWAIKGIDGKINILCATAVDITEQKKTQQDLAKERALLQTLIDNLPDHIYAKDTNSRFILANKTVEKYHFCEQQGLVGKTDFDLYPADIANRFLEEEQRIIKTGQPIINRETEGKNKSGQISVALVTKLPWFDSNGQIIGIIGANRDITRRKRVLQALEESEARYKAIFETASEGILIAETKTKRLKYANPAVCRMFGYTAEEFAQMTVYDLHPKEDYPNIDADFASMQEGKKTLLKNIPCLCKDGTIFFVDLNLTNIFINQEQCNVGFFTDVTQRRQDEEALRESETRYRAIFNSATEGILVADIETKRFKYANPAICRMFGYTGEEWLKLSIHDVHPKESLPHILAEFETQAKGEKALSPDLPCLRKDGTVFYADINTTNVIIDERPCNVGLFTDITERKQAEEALRESEQRYRLLVEQLPSITYTAALDDTSTTLYVSPQVRDILGVSPEDYRADPNLWVKLLHPQDRDRVLAEVKSANQKGQQFSLEYRMITADNRLVWMRDEAGIVKDINGKPLYLLGIMYDITAAKQAEESLRQSEEKFRGLAERSFDMIFVTNATGYLTYTSPACERIFGLKPEEMLQKHFTQFITESELSRAKQHFSEVVSNRNPGIIELEITRKNKSRAFIEVNASPVLNDGQAVATQGLIRDVTERTKAEEQIRKAHEELEFRVRERTADLATAVDNLQSEIVERKQAEESLRRAEERFRSIFLNTVIGLYRTTPDGQILLANPALVKMMGYQSFEELAKLNLEEGGFDSSTPRSMFKQRVEKKGTVLGLESVWIRRDGTKLFVRESAFAAKDEQGNTLYYEGTAEDITERKKAEGKLLIYQQQLRSLASQLSLAEQRLRRRIASELHDHISQNLAISKMKLESLTDSAKSEHIDSLEEITDLIGETIEVTRSLTFEISPPVLYELGFEAALDWLVKQTRKRYNLKADFIDDGKTKTLDTDVRVLLFQAVRELLVNIVKHANADKVTVSSRKVRNQVRITVEDDGGGFDPANINNRDYTKGGFGLFNIRERLDLIGGSIDIRSKPGKGTQVILTAPIETKTKKPKEKK